MGNAKHYTEQIIGETKKIHEVFNLVKRNVQVSKKPDTKTSRLYSNLDAYTNPLRKAPILILFDKYHDVYWATIGQGEPEKENCDLFIYKWGSHKDFRTCNQFFEVGGAWASFKQEEDLMEIVEEQGESKYYNLLRKSEKFADQGLSHKAVGAEFELLQINEEFKGRGLSHKILDVIEYYLHNRGVIYHTGTASDIFGENDIEVLKSLYSKHGYELKPSRKPLTPWDAVGTYNMYKDRDLSVMKDMTKGLISYTHEDLNFLIQLPPELKQEVKQNLDVHKKQNLANDKTL